MHIPTHFTLPKSANCISTLPTAAEPPDSSKFESRSSLNQTSAHFLAPSS
jgi:hypothetical protein